MTDTRNDAILTGEEFDAKRKDVDRICPAIHVDTVSGRMGALVERNGEMVQLKPDEYGMRLTGRDRDHGTTEMVVVQDGESAQEAVSRLQARLRGANKSSRMNRRIENQTLRS